MAGGNCPQAGVLLVGRVLYDVSWVHDLGRYRSFLGGFRGERQSGESRPVPGPVPGLQRRDRDLHRRRIWLLQSEVVGVNT